VREQGIVQPLIVRERAGALELIAGERRWRAAQLAGLTEVPIIVREADDRAVLELGADLENLQRENLQCHRRGTWLWRSLIEKFKLTQEEAALKVGKSRVAVTNALRLLKIAEGRSGIHPEQSAFDGPRESDFRLPTEKRKRWRLNAFSKTD